MFKMLQYYSIASFVTILAAVGVMAVLYRNVTVDGIVALAEKHNLALAQAAFSPIRSALADYLVAATGEDGNDVKSVPLPRPIAEAVTELMRDSLVIRIRIYNQNGVFSSSTKSSEIGTNDADNPGILSAMSGQVWAKLDPHVTPNHIEGTTENGNLVESYIPVRRGSNEPILGVIEISTDVKAVIQQAERAQIQILAATLLILAVLFAALLMIVRRARDDVDAEKQIARERTETLELLSQRSLRREDVERKKFAGDLHEGLAQTLTAIKLAVETARVGSAAGVDKPDLLKSVVPDLQNALQQVRAIAIDLRPPSLDDLGLVPTINALCREFGKLHPGIRVEQQIKGAEALIPAPLKIVIYRNIEAALKIIGDQGTANEVRILLRVQDGRLTLTIEDYGTAVPSSMVALEMDTQSPFSPIRERTVISGGNLSIARNKAGAITLHASWERQAGTRKWAWW